MNTSPRIATERCRYLRRNDQQCTAEAADPDGEVVLCIKHLAAAFRAVEERRHAR